MTNQTVPFMSLAGMVFSLCVAVVVPIALLIFFRKRFKGSIINFFIGAAVFVLFALVLEQFLHSFVLGRWSGVMQSNVWLYALYGGLAAGLFEETGRWAAMRFVMKKPLTKGNSLMYGAGHGGIEAIALVGTSSISNLAAAVGVNAGQGAALGLSEDIISQLCTTPSGLFFVAGIERLSAIALHIALSYIVYRAVKDHKPLYFVLAVAIHLVVDTGSILLSTFASIAVLEIVVMVAVAVLWYFIVKAYKAEKEPEAEQPAE